MSRAVRAFPRTTRRLGGIGALPIGDGLVDPALAQGEPACMGQRARVVGNGPERGLHARAGGGVVPQLDQASGE